MTNFFYRSKFFADFFYQLAIFVKFLNYFFTLNFLVFVLSKGISGGFQSNFKFCRVMKWKPYFLVWIYVLCVTSDCSREVPLFLSKSKYFKKVVKSKLKNVFRMLIIIDLFSNNDEHLLCWYVDDQQSIIVFILNQIILDY